MGYIQEMGTSSRVDKNSDDDRQLRARRALSQFNRRALSLYKVCGDSALLVLNGTSLNSDNALLALN